MTFTDVMLTLMAFTLSNPIAATAPDCPLPVAPIRGTYQLGGDNSWVEFICQPGLMLVGDVEAECLNGKWTKQPPVCVGADCEIPAVRHGMVASMHGGGMVMVRCRQGFQIIGAKSEYLACIDGEWNDTKPECIATKKVSPVKGGDAEEKSKKDRQELLLEEADYSCVRNDFNVYPPTVPNARAFTKWTMYHGLPRLYTTYQCKWGYKPTSGGLRSVFCQNGTWIGSTPKCQRVVHQDDVQRDVLGYAPSLTHEQLLLYADYSCIDSIPDRNVDPPVPNNAATPTLKVAILEGLPHLYAQYVCRDGFGLENENRAHLYCKNRNWIGDPPKCVKAVSKFSCSVQNGKCEQRCGHDNYGLVTCSCKDGFLLQPDKRTCADIDECEVNAGDCDHLCDNSSGSFECSCLDGYALAADRRSCKRIRKAKKETQLI